MTEKPSTKDNAERGVSRRNMLQSAGAGAALAAMGGLAGCSGGGGGSGGSSGGDGGSSGGDGGSSGSGSSGGSTGDTEKPELNIWLSYYTEGETKRKYTDELIKQFEEETGIAVNIEGVPYTDVVTKFRSARASGEVPHMVEVMTRPGILAGGAGKVVNDLFESSSLADKASPKVMEGHKVWGAQSTGEEGNLVTMPLGLRPFLTCWRQDWLDQAGIAKEEVNYKAGSLHWEDDMPEIYQKLQQTELGQKDGYFPDTSGMKQSDEEYMSLYIPQYGGSKAGVVSVDGKTATINSKEAINAIKMQVNHLDKGYFHENSINHGDEESTTLHWSGKIACNHIQDSTDLWGDYWEEKESQMEDGFYSWGVPMNGGTKSALSWLPSLGFIDGAFSGQSELDAAMKLMEYWIGDSEQAVENAKNLGFVPVATEQIQNEDYFGKTQVHEDFWRGAASRFLEEFVPSTIPAVQGASAITYEIPRKMHQRILSQGESVESAADTAAEEIQALLDKNQ
jgi:ABC-type glycerol-3-phosphate transport system substrate-binding protein